MNDETLKEAFAPSSSIKFDSKYVYHVVRHDQLEGATADRWEVVALTPTLEKAIVRRTRAADEADMANARMLKECDAVNVKLTEEARALENRSATRGVRIGELEDDIDRLKKRLSAEEAARTRLFESLEFMEADVAKVRSEIGEARWREIIGLRPDAD